MISCKPSLLAVLLSCSHLLPAVSAKDMPPAPAPPRKIAFAKPSKETIENGLSVLIVERPGLPLVCARMLIKSGAEVDPSDLAGLANLTAALLTKGTESRTAPEIAQEIEALGASIESGAKWDSTFVMVNTLSTQLPKAMELLADLVRHPAFKEEEIEHLRKQTLDDLRVSLDEPGTVARFAAGKVIFGNQPYGHPATGTPESIGRMGRDAIVRLHRTYYRPSNAILVISGDITVQQAVELARKNFGDWADPSEPLPQRRDGETTAPDRRVVVIDSPAAGQAAVMLGKTGIERSAADYAAGEVANGILGGGYSSRLNGEIRVKRGLSYGAGSVLEARRLPGPFMASAQTKNLSAAEVASLMIQEMTKLSGAVVGDEELIPRKAALTAEFARKLETNEGFASTVGGFELHGLPVDSANTFVESVESVTSGDVLSFARKHLQPGQSSIVIVGRAKDFREPLLKAFKKVEFIRGDELDLNEASLKRKSPAN